MNQNDIYEGTVEFTTNVLTKGCAVACKICPQELLASKYQSTKDTRYLSFEDFATILDKVPTTYRIDFSGYAEPFLNKDCGRMIEYANLMSYPVCVYTTLVGASHKDIDILHGIMFAAHCPLTIHLPDKHGVMPIKVTDKYRELLRYLISKEIPHTYFMTMEGMGEVHPDVADLVGRLPNFEPISRANNLDNVKNVHRVSGKIRCNPMPKLNHNIVLPDGNVQLCCMDYGLKHTLGNLLTDSHESLFEGEELIKIKEAMENDSEDILCRHCEMAEQI